MDVKSGNRPEERVDSPSLLPRQVCLLVFVGDGEIVCIAHTLVRAHKLHSLLRSYLFLFFF